MTIIIPNRQTKTIVQSMFKFLGSIWASFNLDLITEKGVIKVSPRLKISDSSINNANMGLPIAFRYANERIYTIAGTRVFSGVTTGLINTTYTENAGTGAKTNYDPLYSDMEFFDGGIYTTTVDELMKYTAGTDTWTEIDSAFASETSPHPLCYFKKYNRLYYADNAFIASIDTADSVSSGSYEVDLGVSATEIVTCMKSSASSIFIGTLTPSSGTDNGDMRGAVYEWDGISSTITRKYILESAGVVAMVIKNDLPYIMDTTGSLLEYRGNSFEVIGKLPYGTILPYNNSTVGNNRYIHPNGFIATNYGTFKVLVNNLLGDSSGSINENMPSGIWEWSAENGFVHTRSATYTSGSGSTVTDYGQNRVSAVGALFDIDRYSTSASKNGTLLAGMNIYTDASSTISAVFFDDSSNTLPKYGYFVTSWISSTAIKDSWKKLAVKYRRFLDASDTITLKYRTREDISTEITLTWVNGTSFTTATDLTNYVGYEVEVLQGVGSGNCAHITSVTGSGTYTVVIDTTIVGFTVATAKARVQKWKKSLVVSNLNDEFAITTLTAVASSRIQIKCCMRFRGEDELHELMIINAPHTLE